MKLKFFYPLWGSANIPFETFCENIKTAGFDGVECDLPLDKVERQQMLDCLRSMDLELIAVELALQHSHHIHSRIGHTQGPQVNDPKAPEWEEAKAFHLECWKKVALRPKKRNAQALHITTEFGPFPYLVSMPYTLKPPIPQCDANIYMKDLLTTTLTPLLADNIITQ